MRGSREPVEEQEMNEITEQVKVRRNRRFRSRRSAKFEGGERPAFNQVVA